MFHDDLFEIDTSATGYGYYFGGKGTFYNNSNGIVVSFGLEYSNTRPKFVDAKEVFNAGIISLTMSFGYMFL